MVRTNEIARFVNNYVVIALNTRSKLTAVTLDGAYHCLLLASVSPANSDEPCHSVETVLSEAYGTCAQWLPHVGRTGTLIPAVKTWMASIHPLYALDLALWPALRYSTYIFVNRIITFIHIILYGYIPISKNSISGGRIWLLLFSL